MNSQLERLVEGIGSLVGSPFHASVYTSSVKLTDEWPRTADTIFGCTQWIESMFKDDVEPW